MSDNNINPKTQDENLNSHLLPLHISHRNSGDNLLKYQVNSSLTLMTMLFYKALKLQGEIGC